VADPYNHIRERIAQIAFERQRLERRSGLLAELEKELRLLLKDEPRTAASILAAADSNGGRKRKRLRQGNLSPLAARIDQLLVSGSKTKKELTRALSDFNFGDKSPKRMIHLTLVNMKKHGIAEPTGTEDSWRLIRR